MAASAVLIPIPEHLLYQKRAQQLKGNQLSPMHHSVCTGLSIIHTYEDSMAINQFILL